MPVPYKATAETWERDRRDRGSMRYVNVVFSLQREKANPASLIETQKEMLL